jgi:hypothetical protein
MSFLSVLVELEIFSEVTLDFMLVGHTGNQVREALNKNKVLNFVNWPKFSTLFYLRASLISIHGLPSTADLYYLPNS